MMIDLVDYESGKKYQGYYKCDVVVLQKWFEYILIVYIV